MNKFTTMLTKEQRVQLDNAMKMNSAYPVMLSGYQTTLKYLQRIKEEENSPLAEKLYIEVAAELCSCLNELWDKYCKHK